uniref:Uncharacterized protein n=1 Tax=Anguilla anguilla TaxID=7936 RepID=A0A0E9VNR0_ANGAN
MAYCSPRMPVSLLFRASIHDKVTEIASWRKLRQRGKGRDRTDETSE